MISELHTILPNVRVIFKFSSREKKIVALGLQFALWKFPIHNLERLPCQSVARRHSKDNLAAQNKFVAYPGTPVAHHHFVAQLSFKLRHLFPESFLSLNIRTRIFSFYGLAWPLSYRRYRVKAALCSLYSFSRILSLPQLFLCLFHLIILV